MPTYGINSLSADPDSGVVISPAWAQDVLALGVKKVRIAVTADAHNHLPLALYQRAVQVYRDAGIEVCAVLPLSFNRPWLEPRPRAIYPNETLTYHDNKRINQYILDTCRRALTLAHALVPLGVTQYCVSNEPNLQAEIKVGENTPPVPGDKAPALAPEVFASLAYEVAGYLIHGGATHVELGALSWISSSGEDQGNSYCAKYLRDALLYLRSTGVQGLNVSCVSLNAEGTWGAATAQAMRHALTVAIAGAGYVDLPLVIGEFGVRNHGMDPAVAAASCAALASVATELHLFSHHFYDDYGTRAYSVGGTPSMFVPIDPPLPWYAAYQQMVRPAPVGA